MKRPLVFISPLLCFALLSVAVATQAQTPTSPSALPQGCKANEEPQSEAEAALYAENWGQAAKLYQGLAKRDAGSFEARAGLIRVALGQGHIDDALKNAIAMANENPQDVVAQTVLGETYIRRGELTPAIPVLEKSLALNACYERTHLEEARLQNLMGYHASAARQLAQAHALKPQDEEIALVWMWSLPPAERYPLLKEFVGHAKYLNADDREDLKSNILEGEARMKSHCTVTSPPQGTKTTLFENAVLTSDPGRPTIDATLNGEKHRIAFSTTDSDVIFPQHTAAHLGLVPLMKLTYADLYGGGRIHYYLAKLDSLRIGDIEFKNCIVTVNDENPGSSLYYAQTLRNPTGADASIGAMFLSDFLIGVDSPNRQLTLSPLPTLTAKSDSTGLPLWSAAAQDSGGEVPSINGGAWGQYNRTADPAMKSWTPLTRYRTAMWIPTKIGSGPDVQFLLELSAPWPRVSTNASGKTATLETLAQGKTIPFHGYFMDFAGLLFPIDSWTSLRYDEFSKHLKIETSGDIGQDALRQTAFTLDLRDNLVHFERRKAK
jgi:tetratricopeptide (TPR) repeat protein